MNDETTIVLTEKEMDSISRALFGEHGTALQRILERKFINIQGFSVDPYLHAFKSGQRSVALALCACAAKVVGTEQPPDLIDLRENK